jgi:hypothetical protein
VPGWPSVSAQRADPEPRSKEYYNGRLADRSMLAVKAKRARRTEPDWSQDEVPCAEYPVKAQS